MLFLVLNLPLLYHTRKTLQVDRIMQTWAFKFILCSNNTELPICTSYVWKFFLLQVLFQLIQWLKLSLKLLAKIPVPSLL